MIKLEAQAISKLEESKACFGESAEGAQSEKLIMKPYPDAGRIEAQAISVEYVMKQSQKRVMALFEVSFTVQEGQFVALVGPSGCGKSTLLNVIAGLQKLTIGRCLLNGQEIKGPALIERWYFSRQP